MVGKQLERNFVFGEAQIEMKGRVRILVGVKESCEFGHLCRIQFGSACLCLSHSLACLRPYNISKWHSLKVSYGQIYRLEVCFGFRKL